MKENEAPELVVLQPLEKLVKIKRGRKYVQIQPELLSRIDLWKLNHLLKFDLPRPGTHVIFDCNAELKRFEINVEIDAPYRGWPEPNHAFRNAFLGALSAAAYRIGRKTYDPGSLDVFVTTGRHDAVTVCFYIYNRSASETINILNQTVNEIFEDLPQILMIVGQGPRPGEYEDE